MNTTSSLKVTVNGRKYFITGIQKDTSCKDLLCAIAKVTKHSLTNISETKKKGEEKAFRAVYGVKHSEIKYEENLLEKFKGDREKVGDFESLKIFNSLGAKAKIISRETVAIEKELDVDECSHVYNKRKKKKKRLKEEERIIKTKEIDRKSSKIKEKHSREKSFITRFETKKSERKHRSVDDSDLDSYKQENISRLKKRKARAHDDSDIEIYRDLFHIVIDQTKTLSKLKKQSKDIRKIEWVKELQKSTQVYHFHNEMREIEMVDANEADINVVLEKDEGNDSGLPSPEYDSSESHENHPVKTNYPHVSNNVPNQTLETISIQKDKHSSLLNHNSLKNKQSSLQNRKYDNTDITQNEKKQNKKDLEIKPDQTISDNRKDDLKSISENVIKDDLIRHTKESVSRMSSKVLITEESSLTSNYMRHNNSNKNLVDCNKNVISKSSSEEEASRKMVAFDVALLQQKALANSSKKNEKKKIQKTEISDPLLLSPNTFERHKISKKASALLGFDTVSDVIKREKELQQLRTMHEDSSMDKKEKEKFYNKKLKEIRKSKKPKSTSFEPEYLPRLSFEDEKETLELNVFQKKNKHKLKVKKQKPKERKLKVVKSREKQKEIDEIIVSTEHVKTNENTESRVDSNITNHKNSTHNTDENNKEQGEKTRILNDQSTTCLTNGKTTEVETNGLTNIESRQKYTKTENKEVYLPAFTNLDNLSDTSSLSSVGNNRNSIISSSSETQFPTDTSIVLTENDKYNMLKQYEEEMRNLNSLVERILDYNLLISQMSEEIEIISHTENFKDTDSDLDKEEETILKEIENVKSLLRSVSDLTRYQRKEMTDNLSLLDKLDLDVRTKKAGYNNLKSGSWKTNSYSAPRRLIQKRNSQHGTTNRKGGTSFV